MPFQPSVEAVFGLLDADNDGIVTLAEALKGVGEHFDAVDQNKDGVLDKAEFDSWFGRANPDASRFFLMLHDLDGDSKVTRAEFENPVKKRFALFDRNDDGKVTPEEVAFAKLLMQGGPAGLLVPPMPAAPQEAPPMPPPMPPQAMPMGQGAPMGQVMPQVMPQPVPQVMPQMGPQGMGGQGLQMAPQQMPQFQQYQSAPGPQYMPQSQGPAPGVYGPGGQPWNPGRMQGGMPSYQQGGERPMYAPQMQMR